MEFEKSKVYTAVNADEVKIGSKGYFSDSLACLMKYVTVEDIGSFSSIVHIADASEEHRFYCEGSHWNLFYLVEEPQEKKLRSYKDTDEMIDYFYRHFNLVPQEHCLPTIWIKRITTGVKYLVVRIGANEVTIMYDSVAHTLDISELENEYTYLDDSPCGIEEDD